jgi:hypothetical protein
MRIHLQANLASAFILLSKPRNNPPLGGFPRRVTNDVHAGRRRKQETSPQEEQYMHKLALIAGALAIVSAPALAASATSDKPMVVAEEGVSVSVGDHDRDHDRDHHRKVIVIHHHDEDHHRVVIRHHDDDHGDHDHDQH